METYKPLDDSFSSPHLGTQILSYSKRLMNKVVALADDHDISIYYTDTDSIHIDEAGVEPLAKLYEEKYGEKLIGKKLGQFHCDFDPDEWKDEETKEKWVKNVKSMGLITLGKKSYIDKLTGVDKEGNTHETFHIRLKGISQAAIEDHVKKEKRNNADYDEWALFTRLYGGSEIKFNLGVNNKVRFQKSKDQEFFTYAKNFTRKVKFS